MGEKFPRELTRWLVKVQNDFEAEDSDEEERSDLRLITVVDAHKVVINYNVKSPENISLEDHLLQTLRVAIEQPFFWKPRRPSCISFQDCAPISSEQLHKLGLKLGQEESSCLADDPMDIIRACSLCRRRGQKELFQPCPRCQAVYYCSDACLIKDGFHAEDSHGHEVWCERMKSYCGNDGHLADLPFSFIADTTHSEFTPEKFKAFLRKHGVFDKGLWSRELPQQGSTCSPKYGELIGQGEHYVLPEASKVFSQKPVNVPGILTSWEAYYKWRGFSMDSIVALLLPMTMTIYHIISIRFPDILDTPHTNNQECINIHLIGVEKEAYFLITLKELGNLIPDRKFKIIMIGPEISPNVDYNNFSIDNVDVHLRRGLYHNLDDLNEPDVVIGLNAGLAAYSTWIETLEKLKKLRVPTFFTDYCRYSCECSRGPVEALHIGTLSDVWINPFRSPVRQYCEEHIMPWYSNAFIFGINFSD